MTIVKVVMIIIVIIKINLTLKTREVIIIK